MYDATNDPYCYDGTTVLKNIPDLKTQSELDAFEAIATAQRSDEPLPAGAFDVAHYQAVHKHLFQDVYAWAGEFRTVRIGKDGSPFCYPEHIQEQMTELFANLKTKDFLHGLSLDQFATKAAKFLTTLNAIHPFREGNGRAQSAFLALLAHQAGHPLDLEKIEPKEFLAAMIASFEDNITPLTGQIKHLSE